MAISKNKIQRICAIYSIIKNARKPISKQNLLNKVNAMTTGNICVSSLEKSMFDLKMDFDVDITYSKSKNGYVIQEPSDYEFITRLFEYLRIQELKLVEQCLILMKNVKS